MCLYTSRQILMQISTCMYRPIFPSFVHCEDLEAITKQQLAHLILNIGSQNTILQRKVPGLRKKADLRTTLVLEHHILWYQKVQLKCQARFNRKPFWRPDKTLGIGGKEMIPSQKEENLNKNFIFPSMKTQSNTGEV